MTPSRLRWPRRTVALSAGLATRYGALVLDGLFPATCLLCNAAGAPLCDSCRDDATGRARHACPCCAIPLPVDAHARRCGRCLRRAPAFDRTFAAATYEAPFAQLVRGFKYGAALAYAPLFADLLHARITALDPAIVDDIDLLLPVPLAHERMASRGFNQSIEIARLLARRIGKPLDTRSVLRIHDTSPQAALPFEARRRNIRGAFCVVDARRADLTGRRVAVVDDVMTTGATLDELARTLKRAGVTSVSNCVVARTP